jgi:hypothetical protein
LAARRPWRLDSVVTSWCGHCGRRDVEWSRCVVPSTLQSASSSPRSRRAPPRSRRAGRAGRSLSNRSGGRAMPELRYMATTSPQLRPYVADVAMNPVTGLPWLLPRIRQQAGVTLGAHEPRSGYHPTALRAPSRVSPPAIARPFSTQMRSSIREFHRRRDHSQHAALRTPTADVPPVT